MLAEHAGSRVLTSSILLGLPISSLHLTNVPCTNIDDISLAIFICSEFTFFNASSNRELLILALADCLRFELLASVVSIASVVIVVSVASVDVVVVASVGVVVDGCCCC